MHAIIKLAAINIIRWGPLSKRNFNSGDDEIWSFYKTTLTYFLILQRSYI